MANNKNGLWPTQTFEYGPVKATVERQTVQHSIAYSRVLSRLPKTDSIEDQIHQQIFARMATQTTTVEGLDLEWPALGAEAQAWKQAYEDFLRMDGGLMNRFYQALEDVDAPPSAKEFWPTHRLTEDERKNRQSGGSTGKTTSAATSPTSNASGKANS